MDDDMSGKPRANPRYKHIPDEHEFESTNPTSGITRRYKVHQFQRDGEWWYTGLSIMTRSGWYLVPSRDKKFSILEELIKKLADG